MGKKKIVKKGKKPHKNKPTSKKYSMYKVEGTTLKKERFCPRCGPGVFLMKAKERVYCGKCHYAEFNGTPVVKAEEKKVEAKK